jgi:LPS-assembly protein
MHSNLRRILAVALAMQALAASAEDAAIPPPALKPAPSFDLSLPGENDSDKVTFIRANSITSQNDNEIEADGNVEIRRKGIELTADHVHYQQNTNTMEATGHVRVVRQNSVTVEGPHGVYDLDKHQGYMETPFFTYPGNEQRPWTARADASWLEFVAEDKERLTSTEYTTCPVGRDDWYIRANQVDLDHTKQEGNAKNGTVDFYNVPILYAPSLTFPLTDAPKSGFLAPTIGATATTGQDIAIPYYFRLASNLDDTLNLRTMSKRGLQVGNDFRYLEPNYNGELTAEYMPRDILLGQERWLGKWTHNQNITPDLHLAVNMQEASDPNYLNDLNTLLGPPAAAYLPHDFNLSYTGLPGWNISARSLSYQNLFGAIPQYRIEPQINAIWSSPDPNQLNFGFASQYTAFRNSNPTGAGTVVINGITYNSSYQSIMDGNRLVLNPTVTLPFRNSYSFLTLKTGVNLTQYDLGDYNTSPQNRYTRTLPITSIDSGLYFERQTNLFKQPLTQTLEPRLYYVYIPYRDQSKLPVFDTALADFNPTTIFTENQFDGIDRINSANQVTAALTSRLIDPNTGIEALSGSVAQRFYFTPNTVTLPGQMQETGQASDILLTLAAAITQRWKMDTFYDYSQHDTHTQKLYVNTSYTAAPGKVFNIGYRSDLVNEVKQWDVSSEWPITHELSLLGRVAYSSLDDKVVEGLMGVEYNQGCWALRVITTRFAVSSIQSNSAFYVQLELGGMGLGQNPLQALRHNIPGYTKTNEIIR